MSRQVFTISADGSIAGLQVRPGKGFDLRQMGKATITRASEVLWDEALQLWYVEVREGRHAGRCITTDMLIEADIDLAIVEGYPGRVVVREGNLLMAREYDDAVALEIMVLDTLREVGKLY